VGISLGVVSTGFSYVMYSSKISSNMLDVSISMRNNLCSLHFISFEFFFITTIMESRTLTFCCFYHGKLVDQEVLGRSCIRH
jgi:hypothetical protein